MKTRKGLVEDLYDIYKRYQELIAIVDNSTDQELEDILWEHFNQYAYNVCSYFVFMKVILTKEDYDGFEITNEELKEYFNKYGKF